MITVDRGSTSTTVSFQVKINMTTWVVFQNIHNLRTVKSRNRICLSALVEDWKYPKERGIEGEIPQQHVFHRSADLFSHVERDKSSSHCVKLYKSLININTNRTRRDSREMNCKVTMITNMRISVLTQGTYFSSIFMLFRMFYIVKTIKATCLACRFGHALCWSLMIHITGWPNDGPSNEPKWFAEKDLIVGKIILILW